jgi:hypothetical protein
MLTIRDLPVSKLVDMREMSAVRGGICVDVQQTLKEAAADSGAYGVITAAVSCFDLMKVMPVCPA